MKVVLLEFIDEFEVFQRFIQKEGLSPDDFLIVALEPKVGAYLNIRNIRYQNTLPYFNNESHKNILVEAEKIMEHIRQNFIFTDRNGLRGCYQREYAHYVRLFANHILKMLEVMGNIYKQHKDVEFYAFVHKGVSPIPLIADGERHAGLLARRFAESNGLNFFDINEDRRDNTDVARQRFHYRFAEKFFFRAMIWFLRNKKVVLIPRIRRYFKGLVSDITARKRDIVFLAVDLRENLLKIIMFNLFLFIKSLAVKKEPRYFVINTAFFNPAIKPDETNALMQAVDILTDERGKRLFVYNNVEYGDIIKEKVNTAWKPLMNLTLSYSHGLRYILERLRKSMVMSYVGMGIMAVAGELARMMEKRSLFISHGAHPVPVDYYHELELNNFCRTFMLSDYTHVALATPVQEAHIRYFKDKYSNIDNTEIKTGPLIFARVAGDEKALHKERIGISPNTTVITHAVTTKARYSERFYFIETLDESLSSLADAVAAIDTLDNVKLVIRLHPGFYMNDEEIRMFLPKSDKYIIYRKGLFSKTLGATDILISYSSTTIDEALINKIPVILYDKWKRYNHFKTDEYNREQAGNIFPVCYVSDKAELSGTLQYMINRLRSAKEENINLDRYRYNTDYSENFYKFIKESL